MKRTIIIFSVIILILLLTVLALLRVLQSRNEQSPNTAETEAKSQEIAAYIDKGVLNPWPHDEPQQSTVSLPDVNELYGIYLEVRKAYEKRDYIQYSKYASSERIWHLEHNKIFEPYPLNGEPVFSVVETDGAKNFVENGLLLSVIDAPQISLLDPVRVDWESEEKSPGSFIMIDKEAGERYRIEGQNWEYRANLEINIKDNNYQNGKGTVFFVYDEGEWKYHFEDWENTFTKGIEQGESPNENDAVFVITNENGEYTPAELSINVNSFVLWPPTDGFVMSTGDSVEHFNSPFLSGSGYQRRFTTPGEYSYSVYDSNYTIIFKGTINVF